MSRPNQTTFDHSHLPSSRGLECWVDLGTAVRVCRGPSPRLHVTMDLLLTWLLRELRWMSVCVCMCVCDVSRSSETMRRCWGGRWAWWATWPRLTTFDRTSCKHIMSPSLGLYSNVYQSVSLLLVLLSSAFWHLARYLQPPVFSSCSLTCTA